VGYGGGCEVIKCSDSPKMYIAAVSAHPRAHDYRVVSEIRERRSPTLLRTWLIRGGMPVTCHDSSQASQEHRGHAGF
jgi:hypothetical protein